MLQPSDQSEQARDPPPLPSMGIPGIATTPLSMFHFQPEIGRGSCLRTGILGKEAMETRSHGVYVFPTRGHKYP